MPAKSTVAIGLLAIDTSTDHAGIALSTKNGVVKHVWPAARAQTTTVLPEIDRLVAEAGMNPADISGLIVATGPGTFTGLRVGLSIAKGILVARSVPMVGIPTLETVFATHPNEQILAVLPAGRGRVVSQLRGSSPHNSTISEAIEDHAMRSNLPMVGELTPDQEEPIQLAGIEVRLEHRDPEVLLRLGAVRIAAGDVDDPVTLEPTYLHGITVSAGPIEDRLKKF